MRRMMTLCAFVTCSMLTLGGGSFSAAVAAEEGSEASASESESGDETSASESGDKADASSDTSADTEDAESETTESTAKTDTGTEQAVEEETGGIYSFRPGTIDATASIGLGSLLYPMLELGVDFGVIPVGDDLVISFGGTGMVGYCLLCSGLSALASNFSISAWNVSPQGRALFHFPVIGDQLGAPLDPYLGMAAGPNFYFFTVRAGGVKGSNTVTSVILTPLLGARYFPSAPKGFFAFGELRWSTEVGFSTVRLSNEEWNQDFVWNDAYARRGFDFVLGGGLRF